jgi:hypothetical protein
MKNLDAKAVQDEITTLLLVYPELLEDEVLREDMIEGQTSTFEFLSGILNKIDYVDALAAGAAKKIEELKERKARLERSEYALRSLIQKIMNIADLRKVVLAEATISISAGQQKVIGEGVDGLPDECVRIKKEPDRMKIKTLLLAKETVPGYVLSNAEPVLRILVK